MRKRVRQMILQTFFPRTCEERRELQTAVERAQMENARLMATVDQYKTRKRSERTAPAQVVPLKA